MSSTAIDSHGQPANVGFNYKRNRSKAANSLIGILRGVTSDEILNDTEILFLHSWVESQETHTGDILDILDAVNSILEDGKIEEDDREELLELLYDCIEYGEKYYDDDSRINEFVGFLEGIVSDGEITLNEFSALEKLLVEYQDLLDRFPLDRIKQAVDLILEDGIVEPEELEEFCELVKEITGTDFTSDGCAVGGATALFNEEIDIISGKSICLTGKFINGTRNAIVKLLKEHKAEFHQNVTQTTDIIVIGTLSSRDWIHSSSGRKIEKALSNRKGGQEIIITCEEFLMKHFEL